MTLIPSERNISWHRLWNLMVYLIVHMTGIVNHMTGFNVKIQLPIDSNFNIIFFHFFERRPLRGTNASKHFYATYNIMDIQLYHHPVCQLLGKKAINFQFKERYPPSMELERLSPEIVDSSPETKFNISFREIVLWYRLYSSRRLCHKLDLIAHEGRAR